MVGLTLARVYSINPLVLLREESQCDLNLKTNVTPRYVIKCFNPKFVLTKNVLTNNVLTNNQVHRKRDKLKPQLNTIRVVLKPRKLTGGLACQSEM